MESVIRALSVYLIAFVLLRFAGRRTVGELTNFDFVLLLIIGEATQQALLGDNFSVTNCALVIATLVLTDVGLSLLKRRFSVMDRLIDGLPLVIVADGKPLKDVMHKARVDESDVMAAARKIHGLERFDQIRFAVLEASGGISIIPKP